MLQCQSVSNQGLPHRPGALPARPSLRAGARGATYIHSMRILAPAAARNTVLFGDLDANRRYDGVCEGKVLRCFLGLCLSADDKVRISTTV